MKMGREFNGRRCCCASTHNHRGDSTAVDEDGIQTTTPTHVPHREEAWTLIDAPALRDLAEVRWPWTQRSPPWSAIAEMDAARLEERLAAAFAPRRHEPAASALSAAARALEQADADVPRSVVCVGGARVGTRADLLDHVAQRLPAPRLLGRDAEVAICACVSQAFIGDAVVAAMHRVVASGLGDGVSEDSPAGHLAVHVDVDLEGAAVSVSAVKRMRTFRLHDGEPVTLSRFVLRTSCRVRVLDGRILEATTSAHSLM